ncbi:MAG: prolyl oligopeptidase family serine peptidase [Planctomycetes bacterium]|nr:prolyl oligopeptidase family serine peptidase [Planctomycetota bacterium]
MIRIFPLLLLFFIASDLNAQWSDQIPPSEVPIHLPANYDPNTPTPVIIFLHGYNPLTTAWSDWLIALNDDAEERGYIFANPTGSQDSIGEYYWNATDACCDMFDNYNDHVGYLLALVESIKENYNIDPRRIHVVGYSNGGFMAHRLACDAPEVFASFISIAGAMWDNQSNCQPSEPVHILQIHGNWDGVIYWLGGWLGLELNPYPSAWTTVEFWAQHNSCSTNASDHGSFDFEWWIWFDETTRWVFENCAEPSAGSSELWEINTGGHFPVMSDEGINHLFDYMNTHLNQEFFCLADINSDQTVDITDLLFVIDNWNSTNASADINNDGTVDVGDVLEVVSNWGDC